MVCPACNSSNAESSPFCGVCGASLPAYSAMPNMFNHLGSTAPAAIEYYSQTPVYFAPAYYITKSSDPSKNRYAVASLILSFASFLCCIFLSLFLAVIFLPEYEIGFFIGFTMGMLGFVLGIIFGIIALKSTYKFLALAGLILNIVFMVLVMFLYYIIPLIPMIS